MLFLILPVLPLPQAGGGEEKNRYVDRIGPQVQIFAAARYKSEISPDVKTEIDADTRHARAAIKKNGEKNATSIFGRPNTGDKGDVFIMKYFFLFLFPKRYSVFFPKK